ncbi:hypothetical protein [Natronomonas sp.]|uniref:hypothetical protein n=1 Tax=Natronomonas sp. TaxID=2184060 RepID=UPI003988BB23
MQDELLNKIDTKLDAALQDIDEEQARQNLREARQLLICIRNSDSEKIDAEHAE